MKLYIFLLLSLFCSISAFGQQRLHRTFKTQEVNRRLAKENRQVVDERNKIERHINDFRQREFNRQDLNKKDYIGIVFHVLYNSRSEYPSEAQVQSQIDALNRDFGNNRIQINHKADTLEGFAARAAVVNLQFCLPDQLPKNAPAIQFIETNVKEWKTDDAIKSSERGGVDPINTKKYLNVWVANLADGVSGYAQMPGGPEATDGIVIDYKYFGTFGTATSPYDEGKTLTHLVGSYLGLFELWDETIPCKNDNVKDTPIHSAPNFSQYPYPHISTCPGYPIEMVMNFMDNTDDAGMYMFTEGQKIRIIAMLSQSGPRKGILMQESKCELPESDWSFALESEVQQSTTPKFIGIKAYPNPAQMEVTLEIDNPEENEGRITIYSSVGVVMYNRNTNIDNHQKLIIDTSNWANGTYFVKLNAGNQEEYCQLIILGK